MKPRSMMAHIPEEEAPLVTVPQILQGIAWFVVLLCIFALAVTLPWWVPA
jgi:hypothetical protein